MMWRQLAEMMRSGVGLALVIVAPGFFPPGRERLGIWLWSMIAALLWWRVSRRWIDHRFGAREPAVDLDDLLVPEAREKVCAVSHHEFLERQILAALGGAFFTAMIAAQILGSEELEYVASGLLLLAWLQHYLIPWWRLDFIPPPPAAASIPSPPPAANT